MSDKSSDRRLSRVFCISQIFGYVEHLLLMAGCTFYTRLATKASHKHSYGVRLIAASNHSDIRAD